MLNLDVKIGYHMAQMCNQFPLVLILCYASCPATFYFPGKGILQIHYHVLKVFYLLAGVSSADLTVGHCAVFRGGEVVEGFGVVWDHWLLTQPCITLLIRHNKGFKVWCLRLNWKIH